MKFEWTWTQGLWRNAFLPLQKLMLFATLFIPAFVMICLSSCASFPLLKSFQFSRKGWQDMKAFLRYHVVICATFLDKQGSGTRSYILLQLMQHMLSNLVALSIGIHVPFWPLLWKKLSMPHDSMDSSQVKPWSTPKRVVCNFYYWSYIVIFHKKTASSLRDFKSHWHQKQTQKHGTKLSRSVKKKHDGLCQDG